MSILASWQLWGMRTCDANREPSISAVDWRALYSIEDRRLAKVSVIGLSVAVISCLCYAITLKSNVVSQLTGNPGLPWLLIGIAGVAFQTIGWWFQLRKACFSTLWLTVITVASLGTLLATASLREIIRLTQANLIQVTESTRTAADVGGFAVFVTFTIINTALIGWCLRMVMNRHRV